MWGPTTRGGLLACLGTLLLLQPGAAAFVLVGPAHPIRVVVGQDVVLPCRLSPPTDARPLEILWTRQSFSEMVHHYRDGQDLAGEQLAAYAGRTELLREGLAGGSVQLRIQEVRASDDGDYVCTVNNGGSYKDAVVELEVAASLFHDAHPWMVALGVVLALLVISLTVIAFHVWRQKSQARALESQARMLEERDAALAWRKFLLPENRDVMTLDPDTAHPELEVLSNGRALRWTFIARNVPETPQRFTYWTCALAREGFESGRHCWEVAVRGVGAGWAVGVALENIEKKSHIDLSPQDGVWGLRNYERRLVALTIPPTPLTLAAPPRRVWVCLDYERGVVTFLNADTGRTIFTFPKAAFSGQRLRPWFWLGTMETELVL